MEELGKSNDTLINESPQTQSCTPKAHFEVKKANIFYLKVAKSFRLLFNVFRKDIMGIITRKD